MTQNVGPPTDGSAPSRLGAFIQKYHSFLRASSSGWRGSSPRRSGSTASRRTRPSRRRPSSSWPREYDNDWKIARAEILGKNLEVLATQGPGRPTRSSASCSRSPAATSSTPSWRSRTRSSSARTTPITCAASSRAPRARTTPSSPRRLPSPACNGSGRSGTSSSAGTIGCPIGPTRSPPSSRRISRRLPCSGRCSASRPRRWLAGGSRCGAGPGQCPARPDVAAGPGG